MSSLLQAAPGNLTVSPPSFTFNCFLVMSFTKCTSFVVYFCYCHNPRNVTMPLCQRKREERSLAAGPGGQLMQPAAPGTFAVAESHVMASVKG